MTDLEALECIVVDLTPKAKEHNKEEIEQVRKSLEVLDIIKNKDVRIRVLLASKNVEEYNYRILFEIQHLTQEEFYLLKEWLKNDK